MTQVTTSPDFTVLELILFIILMFYILLVWLPTFITLYPTYKYYKVTYNLIKSKTYLLKANNKAYILFRPKSNFDYRAWNINDDEILYFKDTEGIKLISGYIHKRVGMLWMDPYSNYWYKKIKNEIMINSSIEKMREYKLKQLKIK